MKELIDTDMTTVVQDNEDVRVPDLGGYETDSDVQYSLYDRGNGTTLTRVTAPAATMSNITGATVTTVVTDDDVIADDTVPFGNGIVGLESLDQPDVEVDEELDALNPSDVLDAEEMDRAYLIHNWTKGPLDRSDRQQILAEYGADDIRNLLYTTTQSERDTIVQEYGINSLPGSMDTSTVTRSVIQNQTRGRQVLQDQEVTAINKVAKALGRNRADELSKNTRANNDGELGQTAKKMLDGRNADHKSMLDYIKNRNNQGPPWDGEKNPPAKGKGKGKGKGIGLQ